MSRQLFVMGIECIFVFFLWAVPSSRAQYIQYPMEYENPRRKTTKASFRSGGVQGKMTSWSICIHQATGQTMVGLKEQFHQNLNFGLLSKLLYFKSYFTCTIFLLYFTYLSGNVHKSRNRVQSMMPMPYGKHTISDSF